MQRARLAIVPVSVSTALVFVACSASHPGASVAADDPDASAPDNVGGSGQVPTGAGPVASASAHGSSSASDAESSSALLDASNIIVIEISDAAPAGDALPRLDASLLDAGLRKPCVVDRDCGPGSACGYKIADACAAAGTCMATPGAGAPQCDALSLGCGCDGGLVNVGCNGYPAGYAPKPLKHLGACGDDDAGSTSNGGFDAAWPSHGFACGNMTCASPAQICRMNQLFGQLPSYQCVDMPSQCAGALPCMCIQMLMGGQNCSDINGEVTLSYQ